jgi:hypothetical protein
MDTANQTNNRQLTTDNREPRQLGRGRVDESQEVIPQHSGFGCGSAALNHLSYVGPALPKPGFSVNRAVIPVHMENTRAVGLRFGFIHLSVGNNDHLVADGTEPGGGAVQFDDP